MGTVNMNRYLHNNYKSFSLLFVLGIMAIIASGCEPGERLIIDNQRNHEVRIEVTRVTDGTLSNQIRNYGLVPAKSIKELGSITFTNAKNIFRVEAIDPLGKAVFSHDYNYYDLEKIDWKITIPP